MYDRELAFARGVADRAAEMGMVVFHGDVRIAVKADRSLVTQADTSIEAMVREQVSAAFPADHVLGEEEGGDAAAAGRVWIVDPIDATANFARGIPIWATLLALQVDGRVVLGLVSAPALGERYEAVRGRGARCNGDPIKVSAVATVPEAQILFSGVKGWLAGPRGEGVLGVLAQANRTRGFGDFWGHVLVARGAAEAMIEPELNLWDYAALQIVVEEAGGRVTQLDGSPTRDRGSVLTTNGAMHDELVRRIASAGPGNPA